MGNSTYCNNALKEFRFQNILSFGEDEAGWFIKNNVFYNLLFSLGTNLSPIFSDGLCFILNWMEIVFVLFAMCLCKIRNLDAYRPVW